MDGAGTIELKGKWTIDKGTDESPEAECYKLNSNSPAMSLTFLKPGENLLHLLDDHKRLMVGTGAWSYTLNRMSPVTPSSIKVIPQTASQQGIESNSPVVGIFQGRTPCYSTLRELNAISSNGCQIIKCQLTLYQDVKTHSPTTFNLQTIYVGKGDNRYTNTGKWKMTKGIQTDPEAIVYLLEPDTVNQSLALLKTGDNILFFLDKNRNFMVGDINSSYTLSRIKK